MRYPNLFFIASAILAVSWPAMAADNGVIRGGPIADQTANAPTTQPVTADSVTTTQPAMSASDSQGIEQSIAAIRGSGTAADVKAAYENGLTYDRSNQALREAYLRKMTDLGLCKDAYVPAQALYDLNPQNGLALGVIAVHEGIDGRMNDALHDISTAVILGSKEPLVLRTAGRLYAWYDVRPLAAVLQDSVKNLVAYARVLVSDDDTYKAAYYAASQDPTQQPFGHVVLGTKPGIVRAVAEQPVTTGTLVSPQPVTTPGTTVQLIAPWTNNFGWYGYHYIPPGYLPSPGPFAKTPQFSFPGSALGNVNGGMPHMAPPSFNTGMAESGASYFFNW